MMPKKYRIFAFDESCGWIFHTVYMSYSLSEEMEQTDTEYTMIVPDSMELDDFSNLKAA